MSYRETAMSPVGKAIWTNIKALLLVGLLLLTPGLVQAHKVSDSFLYLTDHSVRLDLAIEDLLRLDGGSSSLPKVVWQRLSRVVSPCAWGNRRVMLPLRWRVLAAIATVPTVRGRSSRRV